MNGDEALHHAEMMTAVREIEYSFEARRAVVHMLENCCCDAEGCIRAIRRIDPRVREIRTISAGIADTAYVLAGGRWHVVPAPELFVWKPRPILETSC